MDIKKMKGFSLTMFERFKKKTFSEELEAELEKENQTPEKSMIELAGEGDRYYFGKFGYPVDKEKAFHFFEKSAKMGNPYGMLMSGYMLDFGDGIKQNPKAALGWYAKAADLGDANASLNLANMYLFGRGINRDITKGNEWLRKSAEAGNAVAASSLGRQYTNGDGVEKSLEQAEYWITKAEKMGYVNCDTMTNLGLMYDYIDDYAKAFICFQKALEADPDNLNTLYLYGQYKFFGKGTDVDVSDAQKRIRYVVEIDPTDSDAQILLSQISLYNCVKTGLDVIQTAISNQAYIWDYHLQIIAQSWGYMTIIQFCSSEPKLFHNTTAWHALRTVFSDYTGSTISQKADGFIYQSAIKIQSEKERNIQRMKQVISKIQSEYKADFVEFQFYEDYYVLNWRT